MKLAIFGATGRTGLSLVQQALEASHEVIVLVRTPSKLRLQDARLTVIRGDATNRKDVGKTVRGVDAVLSVLGQSKTSPHDLQTRAIRNIIASMKKHKVIRLVSLTGAGVDAPQDKPKLPNRLIKFALKTLSGPVLKDSENHALAIQKSTLEWIIVRCPMLNEGPYTGKYRVGWVGINTGMRISRADVADFMLKQATDDTYLYQMPMISD